MDTLHQKLGDLEIKISNLWISVKTIERTNREPSFQEKKTIKNEVAKIQELALELSKLESYAVIVDADEPPPIPLHLKKVS